MRSPKVQQYLQIKDNNSFVWAKIRGSSYWPAIVVKDNSNIPLKAPENKQWVYFLHTHNYYWVKNENMKPYKKFKEQFRKKRTDCAMNEMDDIISEWRLAAVVLSKLVPPVVLGNVTIDAGYKIALVPYEPSASSRIKRSNTKSPKVNNTQARRTPRVPTPRHIAADVDCKVVKSKQFFGFLAGSIYSEGIIKNLINAQHKLCVWSINANLSKSLQSYAIKRRSFLTVCTSPREVVRNSSMTFSNIGDPEKIKEVLEQLGVNNPMDNLLVGASFIEMSCYDPETVFDNFHATIKEKKIKYLEAMCTSQEALDGEIAILAAGSQPLFESCQSCFDSISRTSRFLGPLGSARKMHLLFQMMKGVFIATLVEGFTMAERSCLEMDAFNDALQATSMSNDYLKSQRLFCGWLPAVLMSDKADAIEINRMALPKHTQDPIEQMQSEISQGLELADKHLHPMPLTSYTNQLFKNARRLERDGKDAVSIFQTSY
ncbi:hypothetical protein HUJ05_007340 [Dendroctonus ponderosae]|nr:hypothetical protein HUJ05_007340 [Dendroctonus ponderosae]